MAKSFGDIYFSTDGGLEETETVFLQGCGLPGRWQGQSRHVIGELGFGSGLNFLTSWKLWDETRPAKGRLHFLSIEKYPFDRAQLVRALSAWPALAPYARQLIEIWPGRVKGFHRLHFGDVTLTLIHDDIDNALSGLDARIDSWFLDGFSPSKNPEMWSPDIIRKIAALSSPGARLASFTVAGSVRSALQNAGYSVERLPGFGRKRHRLEARFPGKAPSSTLPQDPVIIGAGIAGTSIARAFSRRGVTPRIIHDPEFKAASHNPAAMVKPRLDLQDRPESRFFLASYLYALTQYDSHILGQAVEQIPKSPEENNRFIKLAAQAALPRDHMSYTPQSEVLHFPRALIIDPVALIRDWNKNSRCEAGHIKEPRDDSAPLIWAAGFGLKSLAGEAGHDWNLRYSRGQLSWAKPIQGFAKTMSYGGYAIPLPDGLLLGATHDRVTTDPFVCRDGDDQKNLENFARYCDRIAEIADRRSRASIRVTTADTLPLISEFLDNQWLFTGLGSRGFCFGPLLGEAIVSKICNDPLPVSKKVWARFQAREKPNLKARPS